MKTVHPDLGSALLEIKRVMLGLAREGERLTFSLQLLPDGRVELIPGSPVTPPRPSVQESRS